MSKRMYAIFSDKAYNDYKCGEAVDNNGLRSPNGTFYREQPSFEPINERKELIQDAGVQMVIAVGKYLAFEIFLPEFKRFAHEKVYPFAAEKWDSWQEKRQGKRAEKKSSIIDNKTISEIEPSNTEAAPNNCRIINIDDYRKMA